MDRVHERVFVYCAGVHGPHANNMFMKYDQSSKVPIVICSEPYHSLDLNPGQGSTSSDRWLTASGTAVMQVQQRTSYDIKHSLSTRWFFWMGYYDMSLLQSRTGDSRCASWRSPPQLQSGCRRIQYSYSFVTCSPFLKRPFESAHIGPNWTNMSHPPDPFVGVKKLVVTSLDTAL